MEVGEEDRRERARWGSFCFTGWGKDTNICWNSWSLSTSSFLFLGPSQQTSGKTSSSAKAGNVSLALKYIVRIKFCKDIQVSYVTSIKQKPLFHCNILQSAKQHKQTFLKSDLNTNKASAASEKGTKPRKLQSGVTNSQREEIKAHLAHSAHLLTHLPGNQYFINSGD